MSNFDTGELATLHALLVSEKEFLEDIGEKGEEFNRISTLEKKVREMIIPPEVKDGN